MMDTIMKETAEIEARQKELMRRWLILKKCAVILMKAAEG